MDYTSVVPPGGSAHVLQNDRLLDQHVACYICTRSAPAARLRPVAESSLPGAAASLD